MEIQTVEVLREKKYLPERRRLIRLKRSRLTEITSVDRYSIKTAVSRDELKEAFQLAHDRYVELGYMTPEPSGMRLKIQNILPSTRVFTAKFEKKVIATATLILDSPLGLPSDEIYKKELDLLRNSVHTNRLVSEGSSLVTAREFCRANIFMLLFKIAYAYAKYEQVDDICIAVNPKHTAFYENILLFEPTGELKDFPSVKNAPAILERLDLRKVSDRFEEVYSMEDFDCDLYTFFFTSNGGQYSEWGKVFPAGGLRMSSDDIRYFFVEKSNLLRKASQSQLAFIEKCYPDYDFSRILS